MLEGVSREGMERVLVKGEETNLFDGLASVRLCLSFLSMRRDFVM